MKARAVSIVLLAAALCASEGRAQAASPPGPLSRMLRALGLEAPPERKGDKAYARGDYEEAVRQYGKAAEEAPSTPPLLSRNLGNALYRQKRYAEAADYYKEALKGASGDSAFAGRAHHNLGNALFRQAEDADSTHVAPAIENARGALENYEKSLKLNPGDAGSRRNLDSAKALLKRLEELQKRTPQQQQSGQDKDKQRQQRNPQNPGEEPDKGKQDSRDGDGDKRRDDPQDQKRDGKDPRESRDQKDGRDGQGGQRPERMSEEEAKRLLNSFADDEKKEQAERRKVLRQRAGTEQDW